MTTTPTTHAPQASGDPQPSGDPRASGDPQSRLRKSVYTLLIVVGTGLALGRIFAVDSVDLGGLERYRLARVPGELDRRRLELEERGLSGERIERELVRIEAALRKQARLTRPFLSANDRSRWCTLRALVEEEMRVQREFQVGDKNYAQWVPYAIDKVVGQPGWDTIDMVKHARKGDGDGREYLYSSKPPLLPTLTAAPYWLIHRATGATLGSHPYEIGRAMLVLINVVPLVISLVLLSRLVERFGTTDWGRIFVVAAAVFGTFLTTFAVVLNNHLPAAASTMVAVYAAVRILFDGERRLRYFGLAGLFAAFAVACELPALAFLGALSAGLLWKVPRQTLLAYVPAVLMVGAAFFSTNWIAHQDLRPPYAHRGEGDDWYDYEYQRTPGGPMIESYWRHRVGIDRGEKSVGAYALHVLVGHHGVFSLTPVWLLSIAGLAVWLWKPDDRRLRELAFLIAAISAVCLYFYIFMRPLEDRNYGGMTSAFRWMFWLVPLWLLAMVPAADRLARCRWLRAAGLILLAVSVLSAAYPTWNPWTHPWLLNFLHYLGWIQV